MTWFNEGDNVEWQNKKGITMDGVIISILEPGEIAEDVLDEKEITKLSTKNLGAQIIPGTRRALIKVVDEHGWTTYHTQRLGILTRKEHEIEPTMKDVMIELLEMKELMKRNQAEYNIDNVIVRTLK